MELTAGEKKTLAKMRIQRGIFLGNALSLSQFVITMIPLNYIIRKCDGVYKFTKGEKKSINI